MVKKAAIALVGLFLVFIAFNVMFADFDCDSPRAEGEIKKMLVVPLNEKVGGFEMAMRKITLTHKSPSGTSYCSAEVLFFKDNSVLTFPVDYSIAYPDNGDQLIAVDVSDNADLVVRAAWQVLVNKINE